MHTMWSDSKRTHGIPSRVAATTGRARGGAVTSESFAGSRARTRFGAGFLLLAVLPVIAGCSGFLSSSMTKTVDNPAAGTNAKVGSMLVRNAFVLGPPPGEKIPEGGNAAVYLTLFNRSPGNDPNEQGRTDRLISADVGKTAEEVHIGSGAIEVPPEQLVHVTLGENKGLVLRGLTRPLHGGESIEITLRFENSGSVTFHAPVLPRTGPYASLSPSISPATQETPQTPSAPETASPSPAMTDGTPTDMSMPMNSGGHHG